MLDLANGIDSLTNFKRNTTVFLKQLRATGKPVMMASAAGGIEIEEVAAKTPEKIVKVVVEPGVRTGSSGPSIRARHAYPRDAGRRRHGGRSNEFENSGRAFGERRQGALAGLRRTRRGTRFL